MTWEMKNVQPRSCLASMRRCSSPERVWRSLMTTAPSGRSGRVSARSSWARRRLVRVGLSPEEAPTKTLEFLKWLGVDIPRWLENTLRHSADPLEDSYREALAMARDLKSFCEHLGMPYGFHVESVSIRKAEIEASVRLATRLGAELRR